MLLLYGVYILIMNNNLRLRDLVLHLWERHFPTFQQQFLHKAGGGPGGVDELNNLKGAGPVVPGAKEAVHYQSFRGGNGDLEYGSSSSAGGDQAPTTTAAATRNPFVVRMPEITIFEAANQVIVMHKRLFRGKTRFRAAAYLIIIRSKKGLLTVVVVECPLFFCLLICSSSSCSAPLVAKAKKDNFYSELNRAMSMDDARKMSRIGPDESFWRKVPDPSE